MSYESERNRMVDDQISARGIREVRVLEAFRKVPRHHYVPSSMAASAYADHPLPIGEGQTISQPYIVALMTECLNLRKDGRVLEIGTGSGYQAAILAELCSEVYTIEKEDVLLARAKDLLSKEGYSNIYFKSGDGTLGWKEHAPFDGIIVTAAAPEVPEPLKEQLADGGRIVIPVGTLFSQMLVAIEKKGDKFTSEDVCGCVFVPLVGKYGWKPDERFF